MMAAILNSAMLDSDTAILDSDTLLSSLRFTQKHYPSTLTLTQTNSIQLTRWWQPSWILPSWIQPFCTKKTSLVYSDSNLMMAAILNSAILDSAIYTKKNFIHAFSLKLIMTAILNSAILDSAILHKKTSLVHFDSTWWWQPSRILPCWIQTLPSWIQTPCYLLSDSLKNTLTPFWIWLKLTTLIQTHSFSLNLMMAAILNSAILDSAILYKKTSLNHSDSIWWWQSSWILPSWICPSWIQPS